ncbi:phage head spike fiber domain-containing protein [Azospirillum palustre]|uniref:phage head spike fiber domain-containing protein n=1 Tax=Azospirillum palustre TaxID=2044885 RepID=UPI001178A83F|nr:hypothetical protein [Azospirillum palustre]
MTFTRASTGTYFDAAGVLQTAAIDVPRFDYDPATLQPRGLLIEEQRTNLLTYSQAFDNAAWTKGTASVTANAVTAPDGTASADKFVASSSSATSHYLAQQFASSPADNTTYTVSVYAKSAEITKLLIQVRDKAAGYGTQTFDLSAVSATAGGAVSSTGSITPIRSGWYRCSVTWSVGAGVSLSTFAAEIFLLNSSGAVSFAGDGVSGLYLWQAQAEAGAFATSPIPTTTAAATRSADICTMPLASVAGWNGSEGTIVVDASSQLTAYRPIIQIDDGSANNRLYLDLNSGTVRAVSTASGANQCLISLSTISADVRFSVAAAYALNNCAASMNGAPAVVDVTAAMPTTTTLRIGYDSANFLNGYIRRLRLYGRRQPDAVLQGMTA